MAPLLFQRRGRIFRRLALNRRTSRLRLAIEVLQASGSFEPDAHDLRGFASPGSNGRRLVLNHLIVPAIRG